MLLAFFVLIQFRLDSCVWCNLICLLTIAELRGGGFLERVIFPQTCVVRYFLLFALLLPTALYLEQEHLCNS